jgi:hypothetical protein
MRSQLFGFSVEAHLIYEADLNCSLTHAHQVTLQFTQQLGMINGSSGALPQVSVLTPQPYSLGVETWLTPMDTEIEEITSDIVRQYGCADEMKRMKLLKQALDWRWLKFRETAIIAQLFLSTTLEGTVHLSIQLGWNEGASSESRTLSTNFVQGYIARLKQLSLLHKWRTAYPPPPEVMEPRSYGIREDTFQRLQTLRENREKEREDGSVTTTRMEACVTAGIAISTVKKYDKMLYDRWYDASYISPT